MFPPVINTSGSHFCKKWLIHSAHRVCLLWRTLFTMLSVWVKREQPLSLAFSLLGSVCPLVFPYALELEFSCLAFIEDIFSFSVSSSCLQRGEETEMFSSTILKQRSPLLYLSCGSPSWNFLLCSSLKDSDFSLVPVYCSFLIPLWTVLHGFFSPALIEHYT